MTGSPLILGRHTASERGGLIFVRVAHAVVHNLVIALHLDAVASSFDVGSRPTCIHAWGVARGGRETSTILIGTCVDAVTYTLAAVSASTAVAMKVASAGALAAAHDLSSMIAQVRILS